MVPWKDPSLPLGERCLLLLGAERQAGVGAQLTGDNTSPRVREYLAGCVRDFDGKKETPPTLFKPILRAGNWCAAIQGWALEHCLIEGEERPHLWRAGVVELELDARNNGRWHSVEEVRTGKWTPSSGDLAVWDRSTPGKPETSWFRHVNRVVHMLPDMSSFVTIGGNEERRIQLTDRAPKKLNNTKLLGFISYAGRQIVVKLDAAERARILSLVGASVQQVLFDGK